MNNSKEPNVRTLLVAAEGGWDSKWPSGPVFVQTLNPNGIIETHNHDGWGAKPWLKPQITELKSQGSNLVDEQAYLYFQCESCNEILDPLTKSFKTLEEARFKAGWKTKWNIDGMGYKVYCAKCGEVV